MIFRSLLRHGVMVLLLLVLAAPVYAGGLGLYFKDGSVSDADWDGGAWRNSDYDVDADLAYISVSMYFRTLGRK